MGVLNQKIEEFRYNPAAQIETVGFNVKTEGNKNKLIYIF